MVRCHGATAGRAVSAQGRSVPVNPLARTREGGPDRPVGAVFPTGSPVDNHYQVLKKEKIIYNSHDQDQTPLVGNSIQNAPYIRREWNISASKNALQLSPGALH